jgi:hypothetical protein
VNPYLGLSFIADNPRMEVPPAWFLARLHDYDADLVMLPSKMKPFAYVLARRSRVTRGLTAKAIDETITQLDTKMCFQYGLVPVCLLFKHGSQWNADTVLDRLKARDTWTQGGGDALADQLDAEERQANCGGLGGPLCECAYHKALKYRLRSQSRDAWHSYQYRTGQRTTVPGPSRSGAATLPAPSSSTATGITIG